VPLDADVVFMTLSACLFVHPRASWSGIKVSSVGLLLVVGDCGVAVVADDAAGRVALLAATFHDLSKHLGTGLANEFNPGMALHAA
jgi:hypothetical protein